MAGDARRKKPARPRASVAPAPVALYRRYRPATFAEVKGQDQVTEPLRQALRNGRVHHAYLFSGPRGCGKTSSARILARSLNCEQGPTPDPCGVCPSCVALAPSGPGSIDVIEIDAASHGGVDDARDLRERAFYAPVSGRFKVYIIDEAHMVTREGFNALLKLVEEPPPHLKFVFATTEPDKVIPTIRSRTHHYPFRLVPPAVLRELLEEILAAEKVSYQPAVLPMVVRAGAGSVRDSLSVLDQLLAGSGPDGLTYDRTVALLGYTDDSLLDEVVAAFAAGDGAAVFGAVNRVMEGGHDPRRFAADLLDRLRDLIILAAVPEAGQTGLLDVPADQLDRMAEQSGRFGQAELTRAAEIVSEGLIQMRGTTSPRLLLELICAQVLLPAASTGEKALLARLELLERRLEGAPAGSARGAPVPREAAASGPAVAHAGPPAGAPAPREAAASAPAVAHASAPGGPAVAHRPGTPDVGMIRGRWPDILNAVRAERKVAWMLLNTAEAQALDGGVLTVAFPSEGNARGFASSGHDQVLAGVLTAMLGLTVRVRAVAGAAPGPGTPPPFTPPPGSPAAAGPAPTQAAPRPTSPERRPAVAGGGRPSRPAPAPGGRPASGGQRPGPARPSPPAQPVPPASADSAGEAWPDDAASPEAGGLTGMELIRRQLGGQVIEEIEDS